MPKGKHTTTKTKRKLCEAATKSVLAWCLSAIKVISDAPPMAPAK
jgi:hypothetical protein